MVKVPNIRIRKGVIIELRKAGLIDEIGLRNLYIKKQFLKRTKRRKTWSKQRIINNIAEELGMDPDTVSNILYQKITRKKQLIIPIDEIL